MFTNVINKQSFEFVCTSEATAALVRGDIESYTITQLSAIIDAVFSETNPNNQLVKIDKLEIDLGDIAIGGMRAPETLSNFKRILTEKIHGASSNTINNKIIDSNTANYSNKIYGSNTTNHGKKTVTNTIGNNTTDDTATINYSPLTYNNNLAAGLQLPAESKSELELIQSFIITGEMPWWVKKNDNLSINIIVQNVIRSHPETLKKLLQQYTRVPELVGRLFAELKPATVLKITELVTDSSPLAISDNSNRSSDSLNSDSVFVEQIEKLRAAFKSTSKKTFAKDKKQEREIISLLSALINKGLWPELLNSLQSTAQLKLTTISNSFVTHHEKQLTIERAVEHLSVFEREWLLFELRMDSERIKSFQTRATEHDSSAENRAVIPLTTYTIKVDAIKHDLADGFVAKSGADTLTDKNQTIHSNDSQSIYSNSTNAAPQTEENIDTQLDGQPPLAYDKNVKDATYFTATKVLKTSVDKNDLTGNEGATQETPLSLLVEKAHDTSHEKAVALIMKKLRTKDAAVYKNLQILSTVELQNLILAFKQRVEEKKERLQAVKNFLNHPYLLKYKLLEVLLHLLASEKEPTGSKATGAAKQNTDNNIPIGFVENKLSEKPTFSSNLYKTADKDIFVIKDIAKKRAFYTDNEKNILRKALFKLTDENFIFLTFLTELPVTEIEKILPLQEPGDKKDNSYFSYASEEKKTYIENAGLCLLAPYLPSFLKRLKYLENGQFKNKHFAIRAVYILQYIVSAKNRSPEYLLQFNKLLCGLKIEEPILTRVSLTKNEKFEADNLIASVIQNWKVLKSTSAKGLRESFLQRKGILLKESRSWILRVEKKTYDILLDSIPWNYTMVKFAWMEKMILVEW